MKSNQTREKILDASLKLFNEKKASNVSTVQISAAMKISPGNLYYYYANKEEVIRCIWSERMVKNLDDILGKTEEIKTAADLLDYIGECLQYIMKYNFFYVELPTLCFNDSELVQLYDAFANRIRRSLSGLYAIWSRNGKAVDIPEQSQMLMIENCIGLSRQMVISCDIAKTAGKAIDTFMESAWRHIVSLLKPYFTDSMKKEMEDELKTRGVSETEVCK